MDYEKYINTLIEKGYDKFNVCKKLSEKCGVPVDWVEMAYDVCEHNNTKDFYEKLINGELSQE